MMEKIVHSLSILDVKNRLRNKMSDDFLADSLVVYIEKEIAEKIDSESVIEEFKSLKGRRAEL